MLIFKCSHIQVQDYKLYMRRGMVQSATSTCNMFQSKQICSHESRFVVASLEPGRLRAEAIRRAWALCCDKCILKLTLIVVHNSVDMLRITELFIFIACVWCACLYVCSNGYGSMFHTGTQRPEVDIGGLPLFESLCLLRQGLLLNLGLPDSAPLANQLALRSLSLPCVYWGSKCAASLTQCQMQCWYWWAQH